MWHIRHLCGYCRDWTISSTRGVVDAVRIVELTSANPPDYEADDDLLYGSACDWCYGK